MKGEKIFEALNGIRDSFIAEAAPKKHLRPALILAGTAAGIVLIAAIALTRMQTVPIDPALPKLETEAFEAVMGFEGYMAYDIAELTNANPWHGDAQPDTLPVYENLHRRAFDGRVDPFPAEEAEKRLLAMAAALGIEDPVITSNAPDEEEQKKLAEKFAAVGEDLPEEYLMPTALLTGSDGILIEAEGDLTVTVHFDPPVAFPGPLPQDASYDACLAAAEYFLEEYAAVIGMEDPVIDITGGDRDIYGRQSFDICFYEGAGDPITGYSFDRITFHTDDTGGLFIIRRTERDLSGKIGDYPVISAKEAEKLLLAGDYATTVPYKLPGEKYIAKTELVYRTDPGLQVFMPYYRFLVELPEAERDGLKDYGTYYVPAVEPAYLTEPAGTICVGR